MEDQRFAFLRQLSSYLHGRSGMSAKVPEDNSDGTEVYVFVFLRFISRQVPYEKNTIEIQSVALSSHIKMSLQG
jgi:hypothetical protein